MSIENKDFNILVADDEESLRSIVAEVLQEVGYHVETAPNGKAAIERVKAGGIHLVITDIRMPEMTGIELLEQVKKFDAQIEVVMMTSHASIDTTIKAIRLGAYDYLTKPFEDLNIIPTVVDRTVGKLRLQRQVQQLMLELQRKNEATAKLYQHSTALQATLKVDEVLSMATTALQELAQTHNVAYMSCSDDQVMQELLSGASAQQLCLPVRNKSHQGVFQIQQASAFSDETKALVAQYLGNLNTQIEKAVLHTEVEALATRDGLTGLYNRRHFQQTLEQELERARRFKGALSLILFDIDNFKHYNDTHGHPAGDQLLKEVANLLQTSSRNIDLCARYGGEEFVIILLNTPKAGAATRAENLRKLIAEHAFAHAAKQPLGCLSVSGGYAEFPGDANSVETLINAADKALYQSKQQGRNRMSAA